MTPEPPPLRHVDLGKNERKMICFVPMIEWFAIIRIGNYRSNQYESCSLHSHLPHPQILLSRGVPVPHAGTSSNDIDYLKPRRVLCDLLSHSLRPRDPPLHPPPQPLCAPHPAA